MDKRSLVQIVFDKTDMSFEVEADERLLDEEIIELLEDALHYMKLKSTPPLAGGLH